MALQQTKMLVDETGFQVWGSIKSPTFFPSRSAVQVSKTWGMDLQGFHVYLP